MRGDPAEISAARRVTASDTADIIDYLCPETATGIHHAQHAEHLPVPLREDRPVSAQIPCQSPPRPAAPSGPGLSPTDRRAMTDIWEGLQAAFWLIVTLDADLIEITLRSLQVSLTALVIASCIALPLGSWLAIRRFRYRRATIAILNALMGLPPVVVGLVVYILLSRSGPFGVLGLLFTPTAMIIAQVIIITPLIASITHQAMRELWAEYHDLLISLNTTGWQRVTTLIVDGRRSLLTAALAGFGRGIGEVGAIMIVGGNIEHATRVLTTAIALETGKGDFALALGLGFVLIALALLVNFAIHALSRTERGGRW